MHKILLSIKPEYVERIFNNTKRYEYRRVLAKNNIDSIIVYCTYPVKKVVGELKIKSIIKKSPDAMWRLTHQDAGIGRNEFYEYFNGKSIAYAYEIESVKKYKCPKNLSDFGISFPPQSFVYRHV
jgi:predicted transcriptional regulator